MSAAAVDAVRPGLRTGVRSGQLAGDAAGATRRPAHHAGERLHEARRQQRDAREQPEHADAEQHRDERGARRRRRTSPAAIAASDASSTTSPVLAECAANCDAGSTAPSRTAAIGGTRVARRAGRMLASSVTPVPTISDIVIVCVAITVPAVGQLDARARRTARPCPWRSPSPVTSPITEATQADHEALETHRAHDLLARGAERPQRRELPRALGDRDRQGVEDHEARRRAARCAPKPSSTSRIIAIAVVDVLRVVLGLLGAVLDLQVGGQQRLDRPHELRGRRAVLRGDRDRVVAALAVQQRLRGLDVPRGDAREAERVDAAERHGAADPVACACLPSVETTTVSPTL